MLAQLPAVFARVCPCLPCGRSRAGNPATCVFAVRASLANDASTHPSPPFSTPFSTPFSRYKIDLDGWRHLSAQSPVGPPGWHHYPVVVDLPEGGLGRLRPGWAWLMVRGARVALTLCAQSMHPSCFAGHFFQDPATLVGPAWLQVTPERLALLDQVSRCPGIASATAS